MEGGNCHPQYAIRLSTQKKETKKKEARTKRGREREKDEKKEEGVTRAPVPVHRVRQGKSDWGFACRKICFEMVKMWSRVVLLLELF